MRKHKQLRSRWIWLMQNNGNFICLMQDFNVCRLMIQNGRKWNFTKNIIIIYALRWPSLQILKLQNNKTQRTICITIRVKWEQSYVWINVKLMNHHRFFLFIIFFCLSFWFNLYYASKTDIWQHFCTRFPFSIVQCVDFILLWSDWHAIYCVWSGLFPYPSCRYADFSSTQCHELRTIDQNDSVIL